MTPSPHALSAYPAELAAGPWEFVANASGFSGARIWRSPLGWRLKAWPRDDVSAEHLRETHAWMRHAELLSFVPRVLLTKTGDSVVVDGPWLWDIVTWMPGEPSLRNPTPVQLAAAGRAVAQLHVCWQTSMRRTGPCPAVQRRCEALKRIPNLAPSPARDLVALVRHLQAPSFNALSPWHSSFPLQPCLCDLRAEHVLFTGDNVSGLIDFGSAKIDYPMVDLARLLGDCFGGDTSRWQPFLDAYHSIRPLSPADHLLMSALEQTGAVIALLTWIERLQSRPLTVEESDRLAKLVARCNS
jgi:Ser/Thr protein kinase RdoA (MazF antagonist)